MAYRPDSMLVAVYPCEDAHGDWIAHLLDTDLVAQGASPGEALECLGEAAQMLAGGWDQYWASEGAPAACWPSAELCASSIARKRRQ